METIINGNAVTALIPNRNSPDRLLKFGNTVEIPGTCSKFAVIDKFRITVNTVKVNSSTATASPILSMWIQEMWLQEKEKNAEITPEEQQVAVTKHSVTIEYLSENFQKWFSSLTEGPAAPVIMSYYHMLRSCTDGAVFHKLSNGLPVETLLSQIYFLMEKEEHRYRDENKKKTSAILIEGRNNVFFVLDKDRKMRAVYVQRTAHGWSIWAHALEESIHQDSDRRIFAYGTVKAGVTPPKQQAAKKQTAVKVIVSPPANGNSHGVERHLLEKARQPRGLLAEGTSLPTKGKKPKH